MLSIAYFINFIHNYVIINIISIFMSFITYFYRICKFITLYNIKYHKSKYFSILSLQLYIFPIKFYYIHFLILDI